MKPELALRCEHPDTGKPADLNAAARSDLPFVPIARKRTPRNRQMLLLLHALALNAIASRDRLRRRARTLWSCAGTALLMSFLPQPFAVWPAGIAMILGACAIITWLERLSASDAVGLYSGFEGDIL